MTRRDPYRQYRRHMRRAYGSRHGRYPVMVPVDYGYQPPGIVVLAAIGRAAYRHRSAFRPLAITAAAFIAAAVLHQDHPGSWIAVAAVTAATGVFLGIPRRLLWNTTGQKIRAGLVTRAWEACGISRPAERAYVTVVTVTAGGWLSAAIDTGPDVKPLPLVAGIATVILGAPWWAHRRRRQKVRIERTVQAWPGMARHGREHGPARLKTRASSSFRPGQRAAGLATAPNYGSRHEEWD